jgi:putative colanic acid biosynthesis UDP-glucose lipid carrier transferase
VNAQTRVPPLPAGSPPAAGEARRDGADPRRVSFEADEPVWLTVLLQVDVLVVILVLFAALLAYGEPMTLRYAALAVAAAIVYSRAVTPPPVRKAMQFGTRPTFLSLRFLAEWCAVVGVLLGVAFLLKVTEAYSRAVLLTWFVATPVALVGVYRLQLRIARRVNETGAMTVRYAILGANRVGLELAQRLDPRGFRGYFDYRSPARIDQEVPGTQLAGDAGQLAEFVRRHGVGAVYIALPIANAPRIRQTLAELRDTTASVYFVPDIFAFDLIQARIVDLNGMPALAVCDTPLRGTHAFSKRAFDLVLSLAGLAVIWPLLLAVAIGIRLTSPGPVFFRQRRYGLDGEEILVWKFRTMRVLEDGAVVRQASRHDPRITPVGRVLRRTSIDELPQLFNVLRGEMSLVGPRPHAVAHNEMYRKLISGYMIRHKVKPGITGWAQVHGLRGETDTIDKMERRVHYDLDYLANWSLMLDLRILVRTVRIVLAADNAH